MSSITKLDLDVPTPTPEEVAEKHGVSIDLINQQLEMGTEVELEHSHDRTTARELALDHLGEDPRYYAKLKKMEDGFDLQEGYLVDNSIAIRIMYLLVKPFEQQDAFKLGIIDRNGKPIKKVSQLKTNAEHDAYTMLHRLVFRMKRMLALLPGGRSMLASFAAVYMLVREHPEAEDTLEVFLDLVDKFDVGQLAVDPMLVEHFNAIMAQIQEDAPTTSAAPTNVTAGIEASVPRIKSKKRKTPKLITATQVSKRFIPSVTESTIVWLSDTDDFMVIGE